MSAKSAASICLSVLTLALAFCLGYDRGKANAPRYQPEPPAREYSDYDPGHGRYINRLIAVGFVLTDPEGHTVLRFDEE